jgi:hypothetical protein
MVVQTCEGESVSSKIPEIPDSDELTLVDEFAGPAVFGERESTSEYLGPERRRYNRRQGGDRRAEVRFEPGKSDRRSGKDRRKGGWKSNSTV